MGLKVAFLSNKLTIRGTEVNLFNYAHFNETLLKNQSIIITRPFEATKRETVDVCSEAYQRFLDRFPVLYYQTIRDVEHIVRDQKVDVLFIEKAGSKNDGLVTDVCPTIIHAVFVTTDPHGTLYAPISDWVNKRWRTSFFVLPNLLTVDETKEDLRKLCGIPQNALVFGTYSGATVFDIPYIKQCVQDLGNDPKHPELYFVFMNIDRFCEPSPRIIFLKGSVDLKEKRKFINTCDAMLYGRSHGESFGLACGEFSLCDRPVIASTTPVYDRFHLDVLGKDAILHNSYAELHTILTNWERFKKDVSNNGYKAFTPERVMTIFGEALCKVTKGREQ